jgi:hypothetical protein
MCVHLWLRFQEHYRHHQQKYPYDAGEGDRPSIQYPVMVEQEACHHKKKLSSREIEIIIQFKSQNLTWKVIANIVGSKPETVRCAYRYRREMQKRFLPPKEKASKSKINGRLGLQLKNSLPPNVNIHQYHKIFGVETLTWDKLRLFCVALL